MSSNITVIRVCEHCGNDFTARTTVTRFCGDLCAKRNYKQRQKEKKIKQSNKETESIKQNKVKQNKDISKLEFLNPSDTAKLLQCSRVYVYKLLDSGKLSFIQLSEKKRLINRKSIDNYLLSLHKPNIKTKILPFEKPFDINNSLSMSEAQQYTGLSEKALYSAIKRNNIRKHQSGKYVFVEKIELDKLLTK